MPATVTVRDAVFGFLRDVGITTIFGNPGSTELRFLRDWPSDITYVTALHEGAVVAMADGYAQIARNAAFVNLHSAGGLGNAMGTIFSAFRNQTPLVITAGQQTRALMPDMPFLFAEDATTMPRPYVKWSCEPARGEDVPAAIARAYVLAMQRPFGPTFVSVPEDDWDRPVAPLVARSVYGDYTADPNALDALATEIAAAKNFAIVAGPGVDRDGASDALVALAERLGAPVWVSPFSSRCSFPERHPRFAGFLPPVRAAIARTLATHDVVLVLGAPIFTYHVFTPEPAFAPGTRVLHVVDDPAIAAAAPIGTCVVATTRGVLEALTPRLPQAHAETAPARTLAASPVQTPKQNEPLTPAFVLDTIARALPADAIVVEEAPTHRSPMHDHFPMEPGAFFAAASGSLGWGLPAAIGAKLAAPQRRVLALIGDGSSMYAIQALWTATTYKIPVAFVILDNRGYAAMDEFSRYLGYENAPSFALPNLDFIHAAHAFGVRGVRVETAAELEPALHDAFASDAPVLVAIKVEAPANRIY